MKKLILILFCLFTVTTFAQQKKTTKTKIISPKKKATELLKCSVCNGSGECAWCYGRGYRICYNHNGQDIECYDEDDDNCGITQCTLCNGWGNVKDTVICNHSTCNDGKCTQCNGNGTGKVKK